MTSKERLERIENFIWGSPITKEYRESLNADVKEIKKDLEILEILKRTKLDLWDFEQDIEDFDEDLYGRTAYEWYSMHYREFSLEMLSQEEFNLIKEWLGNGK